MTLPDLNELRRLEALATRAPWQIADCAPNEYWREPGKIVRFGGHEHGVRICDTTENYTGAHEGHGIDAQLIVAARNALIPLLDEIERLRRDSEQGWDAYLALRKAVAADKYPNLTNVVRALAIAREGK